MKKLLLSVVVLSITTHSFGQACPLTNEKLTDLRVAAMKLSQKVSLSPQCQKFEEQVNEANSNLAGLANQISDMSEGEFSLGDKQSTAIAAVAQLNTVTAVFNDKTCGKELIGFLDYAEAFADVANGISPFLALYGGADSMPWAIGTALAATTVKSLVNFFKSKTVDMRNPEQSSAFIQNSCSFYNLDLIKNSIDDLQMNRLSKIEEELQRARDLLAKLDSNRPEEPTSDYQNRLETALRDSERLGFLFQSFRQDPLEACVYIQAYANKQDGGLIDRVWTNYSESIEKEPFRLQLEENYFNNLLNKEAQALNFGACKELGQRWLNKVDSMSKSGITFLEGKAKEQPDFRAFDSWKSQRAKAAENVGVIEAKIGYLQSMLGEGFDIEYSEIIRSHRQIKDALFLSYKYMMILNFKGLTEAWLTVKQEDAHLEYRAFYNKKKEVERKIERVLKTIGSSDLDANKIRNWAEAYKIKNGKDHSEVHGGTVVEICNQLRQSWTSWNNGFVHARAGRNYCLTFDKVINQMEYPAVQRLCFGTSSKVGYKHNSLKNQVRDFEEIRSDADEVIELMNQLSCSKPIKPIDELSLLLPID
ncbi:MAG: hypothetical protein WDA09_03980 [Bacteriovoracaceae bacterium]